MAKLRRESWDQQPGEPDGAYVRFLFYRNLGPARSLRRAHEAALQSVGEATEGDDGRQLPGQWSRDSREYRWVERARAWDAAMLEEVGRETVTAFLAYLRALTIKALEALADSEGPRDWNAFLETTAALGGFISQQAVEQLMQQAARRTQEDEPATAAAAPGVEDNKESDS